MFIFISIKKNYKELENVIIFKPVVHYSKKEICLWIVIVNFYTVYNYFYIVSMLIFLENMHFMTQISYDTFSYMHEITFPLIILMLSNRFRLVLNYLKKNLQLQMK